MKRGRSTGTPTKAQQARFAAINEIGCLACNLMKKGRVEAEIHHLTVGGKHGQKRRGHDFTIGLCSWHHRGDWMQFGMGPGIVEVQYGPSYARTPRAFREEFGDDDELLDYQNELIEFIGQGSAS